MNPETYYDEKAPYYDGEYTTRFDDLYRDITWNTITQFLPSSLDSVILDAGGGTGEWAIPLAEKGYRVVLADISRGMLRQARLKCEARGVDTIQFKHVNICNMDCFSDESFDMVLIQGDPLSYCDNAETAVRESYRVLNRGPIASHLWTVHTVWSSKCSPWGCGRNWMNYSTRGHLSSDQALPSDILLRKN